MSTNTPNPKFLPDFAGRRFTTVAIAIAAIGSACLNVWGASQIFPNEFTGAIFGIVISACEFLAAVTLRHVMTDHNNHHYFKALGASVLLVFAVGGCVVSGKQAFHVLFLEADANHKSLEIRADARQEEADAYHKMLIAGSLSVDAETAKARWETKQGYADTARLAQLKAKPPHVAIVFILLALFEMVKIGGLYLIATPTSKGRTWRQRRADKRAAKIRDLEAEAKHAERVEALERRIEGANVSPFPLSA